MSKKGKPTMTDPDLATDRAYLNGLRQGYLLGTLGAKQAFQDSVEAYRAQISNHLNQPE